ncbi:MAG: GldG family protein [Burkholderiales bacterium]|nr:GldG family protein [Burkholderiales bacterium]
MHIDRKLKLQLLLHGGLTFVLLIALATLLAFVAGEYRKEWDITRTARHTLSPASLDVLGQLDGPVNITAYAMAQDERGRNLHKSIETFMRPYLRAKPDIRLEFVDPREQPKLAAAAGIRSPVEIVVEYRQRTEHLTTFNEQALSNLLMRLARSSERLVLWLDGHGERKLDGEANHDLGDFGRQLRQKGFHLNSLNLAIAQEVPDNAALLLIASPQTDLLPEEIGKIERYLKAGGNLLWLIDTEPLRGLQPVAEMLGLVLTPGTVVDFTLKPRSGPPVFAVGAAGGYGRHPVVGNFRLNTVFPHARQIGAAESDEWRVTPLIDVAQRGWVEVGPLEAELTFDRARDLPGPVNIATAFERAVGDRQQRVVVFGTGHFLSNTFLGNGGNLDLGLNVVNWLSGDDNLIGIQPRPAADSMLDIDQNTLYLIAFTFLLVLPLAFIVAGATSWWRRRKAA